jgi:hypothetical protein
MILPAPLPPLYAGWMDDLLGGLIPAETHATCDACAMIVSESTEDASYSPDTKCCTYMPELWNFLVGNILLDQDADSARGRATVEARIDAGMVVTPLGLGRNRAYRVLYKTSGTLAFGQSRGLLCPHYLPDNGGTCGVWRHRESTCVTWFCKHVRGAVGQEFWAQLHQLMQAVERDLAGWALLELGLDANVLTHLYRPHRDPDPITLTARDIDGTADPDDRRAAWGSWLGKERELYRECARLVSPLKWSDVLRIGGAEVAIYARLVQDAYTRLVSDSVPEHPTIALVQITPRGRDRVRLATYSPLDTLEGPPFIATILPYFDGRPIAEALENIHQGEGLNVDPSLVRKLADFGVLKEQPSASI